MTEKRVKEIVERFGKGWYPHEIEAMMAVAAEAREEGIETLRKYLRHDGNCPARSYIVYEPEKPPTCTCGLTELLKEQGDEDDTT